MRTAEQIMQEFKKAFFSDQPVDVVQLIREIREEMRQECARIALNEPRVLDHNAPDPQHRIEAKIRAIENK